MTVLLTTVRSCFGFLESLHSIHTLSSYQTNVVPSNPQTSKLEFRKRQKTVKDRFLTISANRDRDPSEDLDLDRIYRYVRISVGSVSQSVSPYVCNKCERLEDTTNHLLQRKKIDRLTLFVTHSLYDCYHLHPVHRINLYVP